MYQLETNPFTTKCWTSFTGFFIGDVVAQLLTAPEFVISRTLILAGYGFFIDAPAGNAFYVRSASALVPSSPSLSCARFDSGQRKPQHCSQTILHSCATAMSFLAVVWRYVLSLIALNSMLVPFWRRNEVSELS
jgi:hypothetical protein